MDIFFYKVWDKNPTCVKEMTNIRYAYDYLYFEGLKISTQMLFINGHKTTTFLPTPAVMDK